MQRSDQVSAYIKAAANELARTWDGKPQVHRHLDEPEEHSVFIVSRADCPWDGVTAVGTLGLSDHSLGFRNDLRVELLGACATSTNLADVLATCAFNAIKDSWPLYPGAIHNGVVGMYDLSTTLDHVMFTAPFLWNDGPETLHLEGRVVAWLMAVPISETEMMYAGRNGHDALTKLFEQNQIDIFNINRPAVV